MNWFKHIGEWYKVPEIRDFVSTSYMRKVLIYLNKEYINKIIYPKKSNVFKCFKLCKPEKLKVVILGTEPYNNGMATGLCFANNNEKLKLSPELENIILKVENDVYLGLNLDFDITLEDWAKQGVLLLNTSLTVESKKKHSHLRIWNNFIKNILKIISENYPGTIFVLVGKKANGFKKTKYYNLEKTCNVISTTKDLSNIFNKVNNIIESQNGKEENIKW